MNFLLFVSFFCSLILFTEWNTPVSADSNQIEKQNKKDTLLRNSDNDPFWPYTVKLLRNLMNETESGENILIAPHSTLITLVLLRFGAGKRTRKEIDNIVENMTFSDVQTHISSYVPTHKSYVLDNSRGQNSNSWDHNSKMELANGIFLQEDIPFRKGYERKVQFYLNASVTNVDYHKGNEATDSINKWISEKTEGRISKGFDQPIDPDTVALLISAGYFKGDWEKPFANSSTKTEKFNTGSEEIDVLMMSNNQVVLYESIPSLQAEVITLDYADKKNTRMYIFLPYQSQSLKNLTDYLYLFDFLEFGKTAKYTSVDYKIPKMKFNWKKSLVDALNARAVFNNPDLSRMTSKSVKISDMLHATEIEVNENGTAASAVANIQLKTLGAASVPNKKPIEFYVNRPFYMQIRGSLPDDFQIWLSGLVYKPI